MARGSSRRRAEDVFDVEEHFRRKIRELKGRDGLTNRDLITRLAEYNIEMTEQALSDRLRPKWRDARRPQPPFKGTELYALSRIFSVDPAVFFRPSELTVLEPESHPNDRRGRTGLRNMGGYSGSSGIMVVEPVFSPA